ncbi:hypothetical protein [Sphaerimonospora thailandensis]|uniref:Uncharacterized protein n=1 Tax=Sphaerimonospora thailandensis TaxID=795644 RepID=A0A8J3RE58_9ACTN|nr:hypothetical protein [Sphaerimonospora thailandensis]GIH73035.1 hypothetical protein Mth01_52880 [Sphaerimonospora thailandensis]
MTLEMTAASPIADPAGGFARHADGTFRKTMPLERVHRELEGWRSIRGHLPVATLLGQHAAPGGQHTLIYEDVFAAGRCTRLLADLIADADRDPAQAPAAAALVDAVCDSWAQAAARTGRTAPIGQCQPGLYAARLAPGGRLDSWYGRMPPVVVDTGAAVTPVDMPALLAQLRIELAPGRRCPTAVTQGDPTEPNIAAPMRWLDYEHAGRNALAGEVATLLWYLLAMGGWLVPLYKPLTYARTVHAPGLPLPPAVTYLHLQDGRVDIAAQIRADAGRRAVITALLRRLHGDIGELICGPHRDPLAAMRPWLATRILGVIPIIHMTRADAAVCLLKLVQVLDPGTRLDDFAATAESSRQEQR